MISKGGFAHLEGQKAPQTEPGRVPNRGPEATPAEKGKSSKLGGRLTKIFDFYGPGTFLGAKAGPKRGPNRSIDAEGAWKAS